MDRAGEKGRGTWLLLFFGIGPCVLGVQPDRGASATTTLRIGSNVLSNGFWHPLPLAREAATLDVLSGGRFELGIGAGYFAQEYAKAGIPFASAHERIARLEEAVQVITGLFQPEPLTFSGHS